MGTFASVCPGLYEESSTVGIVPEQVARTADFAVRVFSVAIIANVRYSIAVSKLRRPFLSDRVECIHVNAVRAGLVSRPEDGRWSSYNEYAGMSAEEQNERCGLIVDRVGASRTAEILNELKRRLIKG